ncbi:head decoration protein [Escherichia coli]|nr:head decoration protein [Escherichia coli]
MTSKETFTHYQPLGNSDPAHTATAPGGLSAKAPAMTPLMLDTSTRKLVAWDGTTDGAAVGILAVAADQRLPATRRKNGPRLPERQSASFNLTLHH